MHILLIHQAFVTLEEPGGTRHYELACHLADRGHRVTVIASPISYLTGNAHTTNESAKKDDCITIIRAYTYSALHRSFVHRVFSFLSFMVSSFLIGLRVSKVDLVWGTSPPIFQGGSAWMLSRIKKAPFIFEVRDLWPDFAIQVGVLRNRTLIRASHWLERFLYQHADLIIVNSPGFIEHVRSRGAKRVELVPNGADVLMFNPHARGEEFRQENGLGGKFIVLYAGAHGMSNDLQVVLQAAEQLVDQQEIVIVLVGDGKEKPKLQAMADEMKLGNVVFLPPVAKFHMAGVLAAADACIAILKPIPMYSLVFPNKVFDYMAAGRPVILAIKGVIREVIETSQAGIFVSPGDSSALARTIENLANDRVYAREMGLRGRAYVEENYNRTRLAEKLAQVMVQICKRD